METALTGFFGAYFGFALSPSSYGYALRDYFGVTDTRTWFGTGHPERWDEWAVQTPYIQALVRSGFSDRNDTSFYRESFQNLISLPLRDWGLVLRPLHLGYLFLSPPWAFSLYWTLVAWLALVGWIVLLRRFGFRYEVAVACSVAIFFAPFTQAWGTSIGPILALSPWVVFALTSRVRLPILMPLVAWLVASWIVSSAYLPGLVLAGSVVVALLLAFVVRRTDLARLSLLGLAALAGVAVAVGYLAPVLRALSSTIYPGHRVSAGGHLPVPQWFSQFVPFGMTHGWSSNLPGIMPEKLTMGSWLPLVALGLIDYRALRGVLTRGRIGTLRPVAVLAVAFGMLTGWQLTRVLHPIGAVLMWNRAPEARSLMASGILLIVGAGWVLSRLPLRVTPTRTVTLVAVMLAMSLAAALATGHRVPLWMRLRDDAATTTAFALLVLMVAVVRTVMPLLRRSTRQPVTPAWRTAGESMAEQPASPVVLARVAAADGSAGGPGRTGRHHRATGGGRIRRTRAPDGTVRNGAGDGPGRPAAGWAGAVALAAVLPAAYLWLGYNPVQDSRAIFAPVRTPVTRALDQAAAARPDRAVAGDFPGATLNGLGYRSVVHVLVLPQPDTFARLFPNLDAAERDRLFNRYVEIYLTNAGTPELRGEAVVLLPRRDVARFATFVQPPVRR